MKSKHPVSAEERLLAIARIYDERRYEADGTITSSHARYNLTGAPIDLERQGADPACIHTIKRVIGQLAEIEKYLPPNDQASPPISPRVPKPG